MGHCCLLGWCIFPGKVGRRSNAGHAGCGKCTQVGGCGCHVHGCDEDFEGDGADAVWGRIRGMEISEESAEAEVHGA